MEDSAAVEDIAHADIFLYHNDIVDGSLIGELARRSVGKHSNTVQLLRYTIHICYVSNINALLKVYRCTSGDQFNKTFHQLERRLTTCQERVDHVFPKNESQQRETNFDYLTN